jgi:glycosyltransferase involved in cell wall biosynthesis
MATYNQAQFIKRAIESIVSQSYKNIEIIVIDDGSTDNTKEILCSYIKNKKIRYIYQKNLGPAAARNTGIRNSQGKYIAILDSDDYWIHSQKIEKQVEFLENNPDCVVAGGGLITKDEKSKEIRKYLYPETDEQIRKAILIRNPIAHSTVMFKKRDWESVGGYGKVNLWFSEDWNLWLKLGRLGKFYNFQEYFSYGIKHTGSISRKNIRKSLLSDIELRRKYRKYFPNFLLGYFLGWFYYFYSFFPIRNQFHLISSKLKRVIFGR